jgi:hypothetical protein
LTTTESTDSVDSPTSTKLPDKPITLNLPKLPSLPDLPKQATPKVPKLTTAQPDTKKFKLPSLRDAATSLTNLAKPKIKAPTTKPDDKPKAEQPAKDKDAA